MRWIFLPGLHGTSLLFEPLRHVMPAEVDARYVDYGRVIARSYDQLIPLVLAETKGEPFIAIGESFAGPLALLLAARQTPGLRGVVLSGSFATPPPVGRMLAPFSGLGFRMRAQDWLLRKYILGPDASDEMVDLLHRAMDAASPEALRSRARLVGTFDIRAELPRIRVPVLCFRPTEDRLIAPACADVVRALIPQAEVRDIRSPHCLLQRHPKRAIEEIQRFAAALAS